MLFVPSFLCNFAPQIGIVCAYVSGLRYGNFLIDNKIQI